MLTERVEGSLRTNLRIADARAALMQAQALRDAAAAALWPTLSLSASTQRQQGGSGHAAQPPEALNTAGLTASWWPDLSGDQRLGVAASDAMALAEQATWGEVKLAVASEVALTYVALRSGQARLAIANAHLATQMKTLQITRWREQAGLLTRLDIEQARSAAEQTRALLPVLQTGLSQSAHALAVLGGQPPHWRPGIAPKKCINNEQTNEYSCAVEPFLFEFLAPANVHLPPDAQVAPLDPGWGQVPHAPADAALALPAQTLLRHPSVAAAGHQLEAATARLDQAAMAGWPTAQLTGTLGWRGISVGDLGSGSSLVRSLLLNIGLPLLDGGSRHARQRAEHAAWTRAHKAYQSAVLRVLNDVEDQLAALRGDRDRLHSLLAAADAATAAAALARQRYESGLADVQAVLETQRVQLMAQDNAATAQAAVSADQIRLFRALGGGWTPNPDPDGLAPLASGKP